MFFSNITSDKQQTVEDTSGPQEAGRILKKSVDDYFTVENQRIREELSTSGIPVEEHETFINDLKKKMLEDLKEKFKENLRNRVLQRAHPT